ncbi:helix-turn-helix domain-containing protein [Erythrobacter sp. YT30]|uniref:helix-turn-helix transcriptional regulator n=1 Tax=Erythrobacter sp. YT30 TaxID=1735012 RepID=UPI0009E801D5|nr:helix-turn-helix domain-containing protein [Erythrobacter sp. YT30]
MSKKPTGVEPRSGMTRSGMPLSFNRAPAPDLDPWIARIVVAKVDAPSDFELTCGICNDIAFQRVLLGGEWIAHTAEGPVNVGEEAILLGPHSRHMAVQCKGTLSTVNVGFRPGAKRQLFGITAAEIVDRIVRVDKFELVGDDGKPIFDPDGEAIEWAQQLEEKVREYVRKHDPLPPDPISSAFELASFADPNIAPGDFAESHNISLRQLERVVRRDFGLTPKTVLRRARALDLAAQMLGLSDEREEEEFLLRYFDQSHLIREFQAFFGITPQAFRSSERLLLTINLETRAARRLEELHRIKPGQKRPWQK